MVTGTDNCTQAVGITHSEKGGVHVITKKAGSANKPASLQSKSSIGGSASNRKLVLPGSAICVGEC